jgi:hypothetical protein
LEVDVRRISALFALIVTFVVLPGLASADEMKREGFTGEASIGPAAIFSEADDVRFGVSDLSYSFGGFLTEDFALMGRAAPSTYYDKRSGDWFARNVEWYGVVGQFWLSDRFVISAGPGVGLLYTSPLERDDDNDSLDDYFQGLQVGGGLDIRVGYSFANFKHHSLRVEAEATPVLYEDTETLTTNLNFKWQFF